MKRCWIYCGLKKDKSLGKMGLIRNTLKRYAEERSYLIVSFTSENIDTEFIQCTGALEVLEVIKNRKMDVLVLPKGILNKKDKTIQGFIKFAKEHEVEIEEVECL